MDNHTDRFYDIQSLLKLESLNTRNFADKHAVSAAEYFSMLTEFTEIAWEASLGLDKYISRDGDIAAYRSLDNAIKALNKLECSVYVTELYSILGAYETGNWRLAAHESLKLKEGFNEFFSRILAAKKTLASDPPISLDTNLKVYIETHEGKVNAHKLSIMAVDDSPVVLKNVSSVLGNYYKVYTLIKPEMVEESLKRTKPDLFLLDYKMPEISGFELIPIIRNFNEHKESPIVFMTTEGTFDNVKTAIALGACDFIIKPFTPELLREKIAKWIDKKAG